MLATVVAAHLCGAAGDLRHRYQLRAWGVAPLAAAATAVLLGLVLVKAGWNLYAVESLRAAASGRAGENPPSLDRQIAWLERAARIAPDNADLRVELAQAQFDMFQQLRGAPGGDAQPAGGADDPGPPCRGARALRGGPRSVPLVAGAARADIAANVGQFCAGRRAQARTWPGPSSWPRPIRSFVIRADCKSWPTGTPNGHGRSGGGRWNCRTVSW